MEFKLVDNDGMLTINILLQLLQLYDGLSDGKRVKERYYNI